MNKEWQEQLENKRQNLIKEFHQMNDNPLDDIYPQRKISEMRKDRNNWYNKAQELNKALEKQDKIIDDYGKQVKELKSEKEAIINLDNKLLKKRKNEIATLNRYLKRIDEAIKENDVSKAEDVLYTWRGYE